MNQPPLYNETELLHLMAAGDEHAFASIYRHYIYDLSQFLVRYVKSPQMAEDLSQEVFLKIWEGRQRMKDLESFRAYLFIAARNQTLTALRIAGRSAPVMGEILNHYRQGSRDTDDTVLNREYQHFLTRVLAELPPRRREVFKLCREQGKSYEEVARLLGISKNSVKNHMVDSMKQLKSAVEKELGISFSLFLMIVYGLQYPT